jgi:hypothetical protein
MKFRRRIRRVEEKLSPAVNHDGKALTPPIIETVLVGVALNPVTGERRPTTREESQRAMVSGQTVDREPGESFESLEKRVDALLPAPHPTFAREITWSRGECGKNPTEPPAATH